MMKKRTLWARLGGRARHTVPAAHRALLDAADLHLVTF